MKVFRFLFTAFLVLSMVGIVSAQLGQTSTIRGEVTDEEGVPLPGVNITVSSSSLIGTVTDTSKAKGTYRCPALVPGTYTLLAELDGFQTIRRDGLVLRVGVTMKINIQMRPATLEEEITVIAPSPTVDVQRVKISNVMDLELLQKLPLNRTLNTVMGAAPGTIGDYYSGVISSATIIHGGTHLTNNLQIDGVNVNDPSDHGTWYAEIQYDAMEEAEVVTGALPAQVGSTGGSMINVVTKSGGNEFHGNAQVYYTGEDLTQNLFPDEYLKAMGLGLPSVDIYNIDTSFILGGPVIKDKIWFFSSLGYKKNKFRTSFIPTTILGVSYDQYPVFDSYMIGFGKLTAQLAENLRTHITFSYIKYSRPQGSGGTTRTKENQTDYRDRRIRAIGTLNWIIGPDTFLEIRGGTGHMIEEDRTQAGLENSITYSDSFTGYGWGAASRQRNVHRINSNVTLSFTHFMADFLGGDHEFQSGVEFQYLVDDWDWFKANPMTWYYYDENPYYYRGRYGLDGPHPTFGDGRLRGQFCAPALKGSVARGETRRLGGYIQDSWTIANRLTINMGVRYDRMWGYLPASNKVASAGVFFDIGAYLFEDEYGFNPFGEMTFDEWSDPMEWSNLSPRIGLNYDLFGDGKTSLRASFSIYSEGMPVMYYQTVHPWRESGMNFGWWDNNGNGIPDAPPLDDYYQYGGKSALEMSPDYYKEKLATSYTPPRHDEWTLAVHHELFKDFRLGLQFFYKKKINAVDDALYDPITDKYWYTYDQAPEWWVPFTTTVPAVDDYPAETFTMYFMSNDAPTDDQFYQFANIPESKRDYRALELTFDKRYSNGWSLGGSVVWSKTRGNNSGNYGAVWGFNNGYDNPNWFVNKYGRSQFDQPIIIKLYGTVDLPLGFMSSMYLLHSSGRPFQRTVWVSPPEAWAAANNAAAFGYSVNAEPQGLRRHQSRTNVDFRLEKSINLSKFGKIGVFVDIYNLFGARYLDSDWQPSGDWFPEDEGGTAGNYTPDNWYGKIWGAEGQRIYKLSIRFTF